MLYRAHNILIIIIIFIIIITQYFSLSLKPIYNWFR